MDATPLISIPRPERSLGHFRRLRVSFPHASEKCSCLVLPPIGDGLPKPTYKSNASSLASSCAGPTSRPSPRGLTCCRLPSWRRLWRALLHLRQLQPLLSPAPRIPCPVFPC